MDFPTNFVLFVILTPNAPVARLAPDGSAQAGLCGDQVDRRRCQRSGAFLFAGQHAHAVEVWAQVVTEVNVCASAGASRKSARPKCGRLGRNAIERGLGLAERIELAGSAKAACVAFASKIGEDLVGFDVCGHPMEIGPRFQQHRLESLRAEADGTSDRMPHLAALLCHSALIWPSFDAFASLQ